MAFKFEEQLALPIDKLVERENEKSVTRKLKLHLCEVYGTIELIGANSKQKRATLNLIRDLDLSVGAFLKEYFEGFQHR